MKIIFIGTVESSKRILEKLIRLNANIVGVLTKRSSPFNADFADLSKVCSKNGVPCRFIKDINEESNIAWINKLSPDIIFCFGFSQLLKKGILRCAPMGVLGYHPAELPRNRGRHPIVWALALGLDKTASTFFFMKEGADDGDILSQVKIKIDYRDDAGTLCRKITKVALGQVEKFLPLLKKGVFRKIPQNNALANNWRKRAHKDGEIDFRMSSNAIYNLVRALTRPYVGAHIIHNGKIIKVWKVKEVKAGSSNIEYGKVLKVDRRQVLVKCYDNAIMLVRHEFKTLPKVGEYLI